MSTADAVPVPPGRIELRARRPPRTGRGPHRRHRRPDGAGPGRRGHPRRHGRRGLGLSFWYCTGHGLVLAVFGALVLLIGLGLPAGTDVAFEHVVGLTRGVVPPIVSE